VLHDPTIPAVHLSLPPALVRSLDPHADDTEGPWGPYQLHGDLLPADDINEDDWPIENIQQTSPPLDLAEEGEITQSLSPAPSSNPSSCPDDDEIESDSESSEEGSSPTSTSLGPSLASGLGTQHEDSIGARFSGYRTRYGRQVKLDPRLTYLNSIQSVIPDDVPRDYVTEIIAALDELVLGDPGTDPTPFMPEPRRLKDILDLPHRLRQPWINALVKEFRGMIKKETMCFETKRDDDKLAPAMDLYKCKIAKDGNIDKLKCRIVYRGDLISQPEDDTWNPHASFQTLKIFLAECARLRIRPGQTDFIQAYLQVPMRDRVFVIFPAYWSKWLPQDLRKYCGVPMRLLKSLYGYCMSGKLFWEEQAIVLNNFGLKPCDAAPALWYKHYPNEDVF
jgi:hypothetical protein